MYSYLAYLVQSLLICLRSSSTRLLAEPRYTEQLWALVHSISLPPRNGIDFHSLFVAQTLYLPSKSGSEITISSRLSRNWKVNWIFIGWLTIRASDSHFDVTLCALLIRFVLY